MQLQHLFTIVKVLRGVLSQKIENFGIPKQHRTTTFLEEGVWQVFTSVGLSVTIE